MTQAIEAVQDVLMDSDSAPTNRAVYIISDFAAQGWHSDLPNQPTLAARKLSILADELGLSPDSLILARVEPGSSENLAIVEFRSDSPFLSSQIPASFLVTVTNFGPTTVRGGTLTLRRGGQSARREVLESLAPGESTSVILTTEFQGAGSVLLEARVSSNSDDSLPVDDVRWLAAEARESIPVLIVDGQPSARLIDGHTLGLQSKFVPAQRR